MERKGRLQSELRQCEDEEKRRELKERLKEYDEESESLERLLEIMSELEKCKDEEKRRELEKKMRDCDEVTLHDCF
ncbi:hypothetical protein GBAR_LOCUS4611 [Geodia barretti]|uniref:Uncharacterized protein n=1 Tax=Geodia barretti TaxID=519541 RepID=A0AA35W8Y6_GEOBA|nr:hypothetical protein GBAR_LOCUS4611 [Geodia barretti]